jgi:hypothetical protein
MGGGLYIAEKTAFNFFLNLTEAEKKGYLTCQRLWYFLCHFNFGKKLNGQSNKSGSYPPPLSAIYHADDTTTLCYSL